MPDEGRFHHFVNVTTDLFVLLREILIVTLFCLLLFAPGMFRSLLTHIGISKVPTPFGDIDVQDTGNTVAALNNGLTDSVARLQEIQGSITDENKKRELQSLAGYLQNLQTKAQDTDQNIKNSLVSEQTAAQQSAPQTAELSGWMFLGHVDSQKQQWSGEGAKNISSSISCTIKAGQRFTTTATAYLHADAPSGGHFAGKVTGIIPAGQQVEVLSDPEYSSAIAGGYFLWAKVKKL